jgi:hypothetical protein
MMFVCHEIYRSVGEANMFGNTDWWQICICLNEA